MMARRRQPWRGRTRRGSVVIVVLWSIALAALVASSIQLFSFRQATLGRDELQRIQARWAARAGVENTIAMMAVHNEQPIADDALALFLDLEYVSTYELYDASYDIQHSEERRGDIAGPLDEHSRLNINGSDASSLGLLEDITPDVVSAVLDWMDEDEDPTMLGAEEDYYRGLSTPYKPRNGPLRHISEMELIAGIWGDFVRGEDWNLNNRKDPNEDDGLRSLPDDEPDGILDLGWAGKLTVNSVAGGATTSGLPRIYLRWAEPEELMDRLGIEEEQAEVIIAFGRKEDNELTRLISAPLTHIDANGTVSDDEINPAIEPLTPEQLRGVLEETSITPLYERFPGLVNLNTASPELIRDLLTLRGFDETVADDVIYKRDSTPQGLLSILDLATISDEMTPEVIERLAAIFTTSSNVFTISSRGRSAVSGLEVEIITVVDRSTVPIRIMEYREQ